MADRYDGFEQAQVPIARLYELGAELSRAGPDSERVPEIESEVRSLFAEDMTHVTRDGTLSGPHHFISDWRVHLRRCEVTWVTEFHQGEEGAVVVTGDITSRLRDSPNDFLTRHAGAVYKVRDGKIVFFEGYQAAHDALRASGIQPVRS